MNDSGPDKPFDLSAGVFEYYASQAAIMLAQYENINHLLGPTSDYTYPGYFCEVLLRDFLRRFLPSHFSVDKGFIFGRTTVDGRDTHCPEIDILIHDTHNFCPLFRMNDFVIVNARAVKAMIQVKRTLTRSQVTSGLANITRAKRHLIGIIRSEGYHAKPSVFSALVGFGDRIHKNKNSEVYRAELPKWKATSEPTTPLDWKPLSLYVLPDFVGSLSKRFLVSKGHWINSEKKWVGGYSAFDSNDGHKKNVALEALLWVLHRVVFAGSSEQAGIFAIPSISPLAEVTVPA